MPQRPVLEERLPSTWRRGWKIGYEAVRREWSVTGAHQVNSANNGLWVFASCRKAPFKVKQ